MAAGAPVRLPLPPARRAALARRVRWLVAATISYNTIEAAVAIAAGTAASSTALIGFGLDSVIEVSSAAAVAWQFAGRDPQAREKVALRVIAVSFFALAAYVSVESVRALAGGHTARHSTTGLVLAALSLLVMPVLSAAQRRAGRQLGSRSAVADSKQTLLCTYLSGVLFAGLALNSLFSWSWADHVAALVIAGVAVKEGRHAWRGDACCPPNTALSADLTQRAGCVDGCCTAGHVGLARAPLAVSDERGDRRSVVVLDVRRGDTSDLPASTDQSQGEPLARTVQPGLDREGPPLTPREGRSQCSKQMPAGSPLRSRNASTPITPPARRSG